MKQRDAFFLSSWVFIRLLPNFSTQAVRIMNITDGWSHLRTKRTSISSLVQNRLSVTGPAEHLRFLSLLMKNQVLCSSLPSCDILTSHFMVHYSYLPLQLFIGGLFLLLLAFLFVPPPSPNLPSCGQRIKARQREREKGKLFSTQQGVNGFRKLRAGKTSEKQRVENGSNLSFTPLSQFVPAYARLFQI